MITAETAMIAVTNRSTYGDIDEEDTEGRGAGAGGWSGLITKHYL